MLPQFYALMVGLATTLLGMYGLNYNSDVGIFSNPMPWLLGTTPIVPAPIVTAIQTKMVTVSVYPEETLVAIPTYQPTLTDTAVLASRLKSVESDSAETSASYELTSSLVIFALLVTFFAGHALGACDKRSLAKPFIGWIEVILESAMIQNEHQGDNASSSDYLPIPTSATTETMPRQLNMPGVFDTSDGGVTKAPLSMEPEATMETRTEDTTAQGESQAEASNSRPIIVDTTVKRVQRKQDRVSYFAETDTVRPSDTVKSFTPSAVGMASTSEIMELEIDEVPEVPVGQADAGIVVENETFSTRRAASIMQALYQDADEAVRRDRRLGRPRTTKTISNGVNTFEQYPAETQTFGALVHDSGLGIEHSAAETSTSCTVSETDPAVHQPDCDEPAAPLEVEKSNDPVERTTTQAEEVGTPNTAPTPPEQQETRTEGTPVVQSLYDSSPVPEDLDLNEAPQTPVHGCGGRPGGLLTPAPTPIHFSLPEQQETLMTPAPTCGTLPEQQETSATRALIHDSPPEQQDAVVETPSTPVQGSHPEQQETVMPPAPSPMDPVMVMQVSSTPVQDSHPEQQETVMPQAPTHDTLPEQQETGMTPALPPVPQTLPEQQDAVMIPAPDSQLDAETLQQQLEDQQFEDELRAELEKDDPEDMETDEPAFPTEPGQDVITDEQALPTEAAENMVTDEQAPAQPIDDDGDGDESMDTDEPMPNAAPLPEHESINMTPAPTPAHDPLPEQKDAVITPAPAPDSTHGLIPEQQDVDMTPPPPTPESLPGQEDTDMTPAPRLPDQQTPINTPTPLPGPIATLPSPPELAQQLDEPGIDEPDPGERVLDEPDLDENGEVELYDLELQEELFGGELVPMPDDDGLDEVAKQGEENETMEEATSDQGSENETPTKSRKRKASDNNPAEESNLRDSKRNETQQAHEKRPNYSVGLLESHHQLFPGTKMPEVKAESTASAASAAAKSTPSSNSTEKSAGSSASLPTPANTPASSPPEQSKSPTAPSPANLASPPTQPPTTPLPPPPRPKASPLTSDDLAELSSIKTRMTGKHLQSLERILVSNSRLWTRDPTGRIEYDITAQTAITQQRLFKFACKIRDEGSLESPAAARRAEASFARAWDAEASHAEYRADVQSGAPKARAEENEKNEKPTIGRGGGPSASDISDPQAPSLVDTYGIKKALCGFSGGQKARLAELVQRQGIDCDVKSNLADLENFPARVQRLVLSFVQGEVARDEERARKAREEERRVREEEEREAMDEGESDDESEGEGEDEDDGEDDGEDVEDSLEEDEFGEAWRREQVFEDLGREFGNGEAAKAKARDEMEMEAEVKWKPKPSRFNRRLREMREALGRM